MEPRAFSQDAPSKLHWQFIAFAGRLSALPLHDLVEVSLDRKRSRMDGLIDHG
jgi:hypothetical protein